MTRTSRAIIGLWAVLGLTLFDWPAEAAPAASHKPSEAVRQLQKDRVQALKEALLGMSERVKIGRDPLITLLDTIRELADAELELADTPAAEVAALEKGVARFREIEKEVEDLVAAGRKVKEIVAQVRAARLKVEIQLEKRKPSEAVRQLQKDRVQALKEALLGMSERVKIGGDPLITLLDTIRELADAELELADNPAAEVAALEKGVARFREIEKEVEDMVAAGLRVKEIVAQMRAARLKVETQLQKRKPAK